MVSQFRRALLGALGVGAIAAGCSEALRDAGTPPQAATPRSAAAPGVPDAPDGAPETAPTPSVDSAPTPAPLVPSAALRVFPRQGRPDDDVLTALGGGGLLLDGGFSGAVTRTWMHTTATGGAASRGDVVVLTASLADASGGWLAAAPFASVQTVALADGATESDLRIAAAIVARAEVIWLTGGDQASYVRWKGTPLMDAVQGVFDRGGVVGGTSAGMIILGSSVNDAFMGPSENILTTLAVANPYDARMHFTQHVLRFAPLARSITDPHFIARDRMGRLATFMARQLRDGFAGPDMLGIGVDDGAALAIGRDGRARRLAAGAGPAVYLVRGGMPERAVPGQPLVYRGLRVLKLANDTHVYDLTRRCGRGLARTFDLDGAQTPPYSADVYEDGASADECP